jgi:hypothetical protein
MNLLPRLIGVDPGNPDDHVVVFSGRVLVELRQVLRRNDAGTAALARLTHRVHYRYGRRPNLARHGGRAPRGRVLRSGDGPSSYR